MLFTTHKKVAFRLPALALVASLCLGCSRIAPSPNHKTSDNTPADQTKKLARYLRRLPTVKSVEPWNPPPIIQDRSTPALKVTTNHYQIFTTLQDPLILRQVPVFLESAFRAYTKLSGQPAKSHKKLVVYFFNTREQWEDFTRHWAGPGADTYLKITAGAYYLNSACVAYHITRQSNFSVLAHEGWHQFADEMLNYRLPAWLDEGMATNFEAFKWQSGRVVFDARFNGSRLWSLKQALASERFLHLSELLVLDAGRVLSHTEHPAEASTNSMIATYYAQLYALARFLREANYGQYHYALRNLLNDARLARWPINADQQAEATQRHRNPSRRWNAAVGTLIFKSYISPNPGELEPDYLSFCRKIAATVRAPKKR